MKRISDERRKTFPARAACREAVIARDRVCQFNRHVDRAIGCVEMEGWAEVMATVNSRTFPKGHGGPKEVHEFAGRGHVDYADPDECVLLCRDHHTYVTAHPAFGYLVGLLRSGAAAPIRKWSGIDG